MPFNQPPDLEASTLVVNQETCRLQSFTLSRATYTNPTARRDEHGSEWSLLAGQTRTGPCIANFAFPILVYLE